MVAESFGSRAMRRFQSDLSQEAMDGCFMGIGAKLELVHEMP